MNMERDKEKQTAKNFFSEQNFAPKSEENKLGPHLSAPFYWHCFEGDSTPPFKKPVKFFKPRLLIGAIVTEKDVIELISAIVADSNTDRSVGRQIRSRSKITIDVHNQPHSPRPCRCSPSPPPPPISSNRPPVTQTPHETRQQSCHFTPVFCEREVPPGSLEGNYLGNFLLKKKIVVNHGLMEKKFLISLYIEIIDYAAQKDLTAFKLACLLSTYTSAHDYFRNFYWTKPVEIWNYFKEIMIRHTIEDSPDGQEVFSPEECYDILTHFHTIYLCNLPLVHMITFGSHRLKYVWPFTPK